MGLEIGIFLGGVAIGYLIRAATQGHSEARAIEEARARENLRREAERMYVPPDWWGRWEKEQQQHYWMNRSAEKQRELPWRQDASRS